MSGPVDADAMRAALRLIAQIGEAARTAPTASYGSIIARMETIATLALVKQPSSVVVNLAEAADDIRTLHDAMMVWRWPWAAEEHRGLDSDEIATADRLIAALEAAELRLGGSRPTYNHTRGDGPYDPCPTCAKLQTPEERERLAADRAALAEEDFG